MTPVRRAFAWIVFGAVAFTVYGSLVPFQFREPPPAHPVDDFLTILSNRLVIDSRSDSVANVILGVPLGFALLGLVAVDRNWPREKQAMFGALLLPACTLVAAGVEYSQLFMVSRTCSSSDILAQTIGSALGMGAWVLFGQRVTDRARAVLTRTDVNTAERILIAYLALVLFIQTLPFDVSAKPKDLYHKFQDGKVQFVPFGEFNGMNQAESWKHTAKLAKLAGLFFPIGLLAARLKGRTERWNVLHVALAAIALGVCMELPQLIIRSRSASMTDAIVGAFAAVSGWYAARIHREGLALPFFMSWGIIWLAMMMPTVLPPPGTPRLETPRPFNWIPILAAEEGSPLSALENTLTKLVLFGLLGILIAAWWLPPRVRRGRGGSVAVAVAIAAVLGFVVSGLFEANQQWYESNLPDITDVLIGGIGAVLAVLVASRVRTTPQAASN